MSIERISATLSISYPKKSTDDEEGKVVSIRIRDDLSRIEFVDLEIPYDEFTAALSGLQYRPARKCEVRGLESVGKKEEYERFEFYTEVPEGLLQYSKKEKLRTFLESEACDQGWADGGWKVSGYIAVNSQNGRGKDDKGTFYRMSRYRYV